MSGPKSEAKGGEPGAGSFWRVFARRIMQVIRRRCFLLHLGLLPVPSSLPVFSMKTQGPVRAPVPGSFLGCGRSHPIFAQVAGPGPVPSVGYVCLPSRLEQVDPEPKAGSACGPTQTSQRQADPSVSRSVATRNIFRFPAFIESVVNCLVPSRWKRHQELVQPLKRNRNK